MKSKSSLAIFGGPKSVTKDPGDMFTWPIITKEDENAVLEVLRRGAMSNLDVTLQFEKEFAAWQGRRYALAHNTGTASLEAAMFGCKVGIGDEIICPAATYWASCLACYSLGATVVFADIDPDTQCIDPSDIEPRISPRTKAIVVVHYMGYPVDMDRIMRIARKHKIKVIEDVSHGQGGVYKGRKLGTIGDVAGISLMSGKSLAIGEGGMLVTNDLEIYERALAWGHYERFGNKIKTKYLRPLAGLPLGGHKYRMHQLSSAVGRGQLRHFDQRCGEIRRAMNFFWDLLEGVPGIRAHRPPKNSNSHMGGWFAPHGLYRPQELNGLSVTRFAEAIRAEGVSCIPGMLRPLHLHPLFNTADIYGHGKPTRIANAARDLRQPPGSLPASEASQGLLYSIPWFKHYRPEIIRQYAMAFRKVAENYRELLKGDKGDPANLGLWSASRH
ncbi:MAG: DegT/DnrJ/EryC1/StrS family aminotransferase [Verrucomicrobia bacterium]|nr:DegT/DnrJ/EryC1/StrS family aminotransferase [Verrucomicrobiota bacterium]MCG2681844.1 DegT/DnrJ/EryC1/StrS family aminotransferase [Kiritimatiellia bacterium]MBU4247726.1 DegT/DnrJ/EryC1/StrS family aminotransferase [Verrucomicrobiota bacterium]MBU4291623.1 DegT/DnrJ/EryC1/StrS family aminotransferase [Verrucomicrobiota bacterium]MBU4429560.1 DegT/DnrJ/EryC1/StrS family aminotransferase [Verrucomicrobiota bacterium]